LPPPAKSAPFSARRSRGSRPHCKHTRAFGLAFQIADDLLNAEGDAHLAGKRVGKDETRGKATLVAKIGAAEARKQLAAHTAEAEAALSVFGPRAAMLAAAARFVTARQH
jgi:farnesyl diphosphate synthase